MGPFKFATAPNAAPERRNMRPMETFVWILAGGLLGWMSYAFIGFNAARGVLVSVAIGAFGAVLGATVIAPMFITSDAPMDNFSVQMLLFAAGAALACLALGNVVYRRWGV